MIGSFDARPGRGRPENARPGVPKGRNPCYLYDCVGPLSPGNSDKCRTARDMGLKPGGVDAMTAAARVEWRDYGKVNDCVGLGPRSLAAQYLAGVCGNQIA